MTQKIALFWPGDERTKPNQLAQPNVEETTQQLERALAKLGRQSYRIEGFLSKPHHAIEKLGPIDDPLLGVCVHWLYGPHTVDGVVGKDNPLLLASNFSGRWPGLVGLLNTGACLESVGRPHSRIWSDAPDLSADPDFLERLDQWCKSGRIEYDSSDLRYDVTPSATARASAARVAAEFRARRALILMLGDTSMGMINGYFGPRLLTKHGFTEHKIDQAWILDRGKRIEESRIDAAFRFVQDKGVQFHWGEPGAEDFTELDSREQLRDYLCVLDMLSEFKADCLGWQYQLGLISLRAPSDFAEGLFNSVCRPESNGDTIACATEADQGNVIPMEMLKRLLKDKGLHQAVMFHDVRWGAEHEGRFLWVLLNSGSCGAYAFNHDPDTLRGVHSYRQPRQYFPVPGGTFAGESLPGGITWARAYIKDDVLWMDIGKGEVVQLPPTVRDAWWTGTTREWPFMAADLGIGRDTLMAHYLSNHVAVAYGDVFEEMIALSQELGFKVRVLGPKERVMRDRFYLGVDVGTGSARAGIFDPHGKLVGSAAHDIELHRPAEDFVEQSSDDIWRACGIAIRAALRAAGLPPAAIRGIGFDATCSLVLLDATDAPVTASPSGLDRWNVIVWMDHRAIDQARRINTTGHRVLRYVGGVISPEMETPKLLWLKERLPISFGRARRFLDLPDFLTYRATGIDVRSLCTTTCKWTYLAHEAADGGGWDAEYFRTIGLAELADEEFARIGTRVRPMGEPIGGLRAQAASELGLVESVPVGVSIIDAHAGGLGMLGADIDGVAPDDAALEQRLALIGGTSSCHMACSREPYYPRGIWGPYFSSMIPGMWLTEGGQSSTGALIDHVIDSHARGAELRAHAKREGTTAYALLNAQLDRVATQVEFPAMLTRELHVLPYFHGNRSPRADPTLRGMLSGLRQSDSIEALAIVYLATIQAIAHGTRHIIDTMNASGFRIDTLLACGGDTKNPVFVREHADASGCRIVIPREPEAVLLGSAVLGAVASGDHPSVLDAMRAMNATAGEVQAGRGAVAQYHKRKHAVFQRMYQDQLGYRALMND